MERNMLILTFVVLSVVIPQVCSKPGLNWQMFGKQKQRDRDNVDKFGKFHDNDNYFYDFSGNYDSSEEYYDDSDGYYDDSDEYNDDSDEYNDKFKDEARDFYQYGNWLTNRRPSKPATVNNHRSNYPEYQSNQYEAAELKLDDLRKKMDKLRRKMDDIENEINPWNGYYDKKK